MFLKSISASLITKLLFSAHRLSTSSKQQTPSKAVSGVKWPYKATLRMRGLTSWSTASFPTRASPTNRTRSGMLTAISLASAVMRGALSCIRPAVSTSTTSKAWLRARGEEEPKKVHASSTLAHLVLILVREDFKYRKRWPPWRSLQHPSHSPSHRAGP